jgi:2,3-bisphosphoglycerate-dependent phosphoglycerate mutase
MRPGSIPDDGHRRTHLDAIALTLPHQRIAIVAHGAIISRLFQCFLQLPLPSNVVIQSDDTGIHMWRIDGTHRWVVFANRTEHLVDR